MPEEFEDQAAEPFDVGRFLDIVRRRHFVFLTLLLSGWGIIWGSSWLIQPSYKSSTLILVQPPSMPTNYVIPNVSNDLQGQMQSITQQIESRTRLLQIIEKMHLYADKRHLLTPDQKVKAMRKDIDIEIVHNPNDNNVNAFQVYYTSRDPHIAQRVTGELTNLFISDSNSVRQQQSQDTTQFLKEQLNTARLNLATQDAKVRAFQSTHEGSLPTQEATNLQILSGLQSQLQNEQDALNSARQQHVYHESMMDQYRTLGSTTRTTTGAPTGLAALDQQLDTLRAKLADLRSRYTDRYPEVEDLQSQILRTERARQQLIASLAKEPIPAGHASAAQAADSALNPPVLQLQGQLNADQVEIRNREQAIANLKTRINEYQARLSDEPAVAQQLADLTRGYTQSQANYDDLLKKYSDSQMATNMEQMQEGERFTMIDAPSLPLRPDAPKRLKMCGEGVVAGLALGVLVVAVLEFLDDRLHSDEDIVKLLPAAVLCEIPEVLSSADERRNQRRVVLGWAMAVAVAVVIVAGTTLSYLSV